MWNCKHCNKSILVKSASEKANHSRWCIENPKAAKYRETAKALGAKYARPFKGSHTDATKKKMAELTKARWVEGSCVGYKHTDEAKKKISKAASKSTHRRLLKSCRPYIKKDGTIVILDSSWEEVLAARLEELNIEWARPREPIIWQDKTGKDRHYFPDFWLPHKQIFLDPKNPAAKKQQAEKVEWLQHHRLDVIFIWSLQECKDFDATIA